MTGDVRGFERLKTIVASEAFRNDIKAIRQNTDDDHTTETYALITKYSLLQVHFPILEAIVSGQPIGKALRLEPEPVAQIVNHDNKTITPSDDPCMTYKIAESVNGFQTGITIHINSDASSNEIVAFIEDNYSDYIQPFLTKYKRQSDRYYSSRDEDIRKEKLDGQSAQEIANKYNISVPRVYQILKQKL